MITTSLYQQNLDGQPKISNDEAVARLIKYRETKNRRDLDAVVCAHYGLALHFAKRCKRAAPPHVDEADLVQEALEGLWIGVQRYDPGKGVKISTYVGWWIRANLNRYVIASYRTATLTMRQADRLFWRGRKLRAEREARGLSIDAETMAALLGVRRDTYEIVTAWMSVWEVSMSTPLFDDGDQTVGDRLATVEPGALELLGDHDLVTKVEAVAAQFRKPLKVLPRDVFDSRVWTHAERLPTLDEVGQRHGRTRERIRQVEATVRDGFRGALVNADLLDAVAALG